MAITEQALNSNSLVVLPTGLGKTLIAVFIAGEILNGSPEETKIVILAPTRPLIQQHFESFRTFLTLPPEAFSILTGGISPKKRQNLFDQSKILFMTPQTLRNDLLETRYNLSKVGLLVFDEAHRASGNYAYCQIAPLYQKMAPDGRTLALTASPGASRVKIDQLCKNLNIPEEGIIIRTRTDEDVRPYVKPMEVVKHGVLPTPLMKAALEKLREVLQQKYSYLQSWRILDEETNLEKITQKTLIRLMQEYQERVKRERSKEVFAGLSLLAQAQKLNHMLGLVETQGMDLLLEYLEAMKRKVIKGTGSKADQYLLKDPLIYKLFQQMLVQKQRDKTKLFHPKFLELVNVIQEQLQTSPSARILVFAKLRSTVSLLVKRLNKYEGCRAVRFVGQATKSKRDQGLSQKDQIQIIEEFKQNVWNILVSTNVAEEGLDIAECDLVVFYDTVASEIRLIQRRGRTARSQAGKVLILYCIGTSDEVFLHISLQRLKKMQEELKQNPEATLEARKELRQSFCSGSSRQNPVPESPISLVAAPKTKESNHQSLVSFAKPKAKASLNLRLSREAPLSYGLRRLAGKKGLNLEICSEMEVDCAFSSLLGIKFLGLEDFLAMRENAQRITEYQGLAASYRLFLVFIDLFFFEEEFLGHQAKVLRQVKKTSETTGLKILPVMNITELHTILGGILDKIKTRRA